MLNKKAVISGVLAVIVIVVGVIVFKQSRMDDKKNSPSDLASSTASTPGDKSSSSTKAVAPLPGGSLVNAEQQVVTELGEPVKMDVMPNNPAAPKAVDVTKKQLPKTAIKIDIKDDKFNPESFTVKAGAPVSLAFSSADKKVHIVTFSGSALAALSFGVGAGQIKAMTFNAPETPGRYEFTCAVPGHKADGEKGAMIVE